MMIPVRQIRAHYTDQTIRIYQAYSDPIADSVLAHGRFVSPPFKMERMTWIKPSFLWMMYRAGWGLKDDGQKRILAIDICRDGFDWALANSIGSKIPEGMSKADWDVLKANTPVRIQWDPERDLYLQAQNHRSIQIGLSGEAVQRYVNEWIVSITEITELAHQIHDLVQQGHAEQARVLLPKERVYQSDCQRIYGF